MANLQRAQSAPPIAAAPTAAVRSAAPTAAVGSGLLLVLAADLGAAGGLLLGLAIAAVLRHRRLEVPRHSAAVGQFLLRAGVVALGAGLELGHVLQVGAEGFLLTVGTLALTLALGHRLTRRFGLDADVGLLVTVGTAICGGSAIAATAPAIRARGEHVALALGVVFALNACALILFPPLGELLGLSPEAFARWCALAIHDTSSVVGAAATFGPEALELATITKLARALWIVPIVALIGLLRSRRGAAPGARAQAPTFLLAFLALAALRSAVPAAAPLGDAVSACAGPALTAALFAVGLTLRFDALRSRARPAVWMGTLLWIATATASLTAVCLGI